MSRRPAGIPRPTPGSRCRSRALREPHHSVTGLNSLYAHPLLCLFLSRSHPRRRTKQTSFPRKARAWQRVSNAGDSRDAPDRLLNPPSHRSLGIKNVITVGDMSEVRPRETASSRLFCERPRQPRSGTSLPRWGSMARSITASDFIDFEQGLLSASGRSRNRPLPIFRMRHVGPGFARYTTARWRPPPNARGPGAGARARRILRTSTRASSAGQWAQKMVDPALLRRLFAPVWRTCSRSFSNAFRCGHLRMASRCNLRRRRFGATIAAS